MSASFFTRERDLLVLGELFVEYSMSGDIARTPPPWPSIGGNAVYTAVAAARSNARVSLLSAVARDPFHNLIREKLTQEKINTDFIVSTSGFNGMYFTSDTEPEHREYLYHRPGNAVKALNPTMIDDKVIDQSKIVYSSSEFQSYSKDTRQAVFKAFHSAHTRETMVAYDPNLRLHRCSLEDSRELLWTILPFVDVILPSAPEESKALFGYERPIDIIGFLWDRGLNVVVVKNGKDGCVVGYDGKVEEFSIPEPPQPVQYLTEIGAVFNGVFLSGIAQGNDPFVAAQRAVDAATQKGMIGNSIYAIPTETA